MFALIFIIGLIIILWPVTGGAIASLFNGLVMVASSPFYWIMRITKRPESREEDDRISKAASVIATCLVLTAIFAAIIIIVS